MFDACVLRLQVIGENVKKILDESENPLEKYHEIPWRAIVSLRNIISHEYANVDEEIVFQVIKPKSVIRRAESVFDWESEAFGHLARLCPHHAPRYAST